MNENINLKNSNLPNMIGELMHSNQFLKFFSVVALSMASISMLVVLVVADKAPTVLTLATNGDAVKRVEVLPKPEEQIEAAVRRYLNLRYRWDAKTVQAQINQAKVFIPKESLKAYEAATAQIVKFSTDKQVSQKVYPNPPTVDLANRLVSITGDRLTEIQGLRAMGALKLTLFFEGGPRTPENPWGVYIVKEKEEQ
jgi:hypothetical protein